MDRLSSPAISQKGHYYSVPAFFYCKKCLSFASERNCPHGTEFQEQLSGTKLRTMILEGQIPSEYMIRPEVSKIIMNWDKPFVD